MMSTMMCIGPIGHCIPIMTTTTTSMPSISASSSAISTLVSNQQQSRSAQLNACSSDKCLNGGTCQGFATNYTCICASGYKGLDIKT